MRQRTKVHGYCGRITRCWQLRHVRAGLFPALPLHLAQCAHFGDGRRAGRKRPRKNGARSPSGFVKPTLISKELATFLGKEVGTEMARTEVTKYLTKYIKDHQLQDPANKRIINCDAQLSGLLNVTPSDEVTYFNLQRYMKPHFPPKQVPATSIA